MSAFPTGNELADINILLELTDQDLANACKQNVYISQLCRDNYFWRLKLEQKYPQILSLRDKFPSYQVLYQWANIQTYVLFDGSPIVYNNIRDAYKYMISILSMYYDISEDQIPSIENPLELINLATRLNTTQPMYIYSLPYGDQIVGKDRNHILLKLPDLLDDKTVFFPNLEDLPVVNPDVFLTYTLYLLGNQRESRVSKLTPQHMEEIYQATQIGYHVYPTEPGNRSLLNNQFNIQRSDTQRVRQFGFRQNFFFSLGNPHLIIIRDIGGKFYLSELPSQLRNIDILTQEITNDLQWKPLGSITDYL